jgi:hypothetical protein
MLLSGSNRKKRERYGNIIKKREELFTTTV